LKPDPSKFIEMQIMGSQMKVVIAHFVFNIIGLVKDLKSFEEAYNHSEILT
jgi:hypothetical protein